MKKRLLIYGPMILIVLIVGLFIKNPTLPAHPQENLQGKASPKNLEDIVRALADNPSLRNVANLPRLNAVADDIFQRLLELGLQPTWQTYAVGEEDFKNILVRFAPNQTSPLLVLGAHYDVCHETPGADDNASGVAGLLELARLLKINQDKLTRTVELVFYTLEEPPYFYTDHMGSAVHARGLEQTGTSVALMISLEMIGRFSDRDGSQKFPIPLLNFLYPSKGNFIALIGRTEDWWLTRNVKSVLQIDSQIDVQSINAPTLIQGIDYSDHLNYWARNMPALMISDTSFFRNFDYHKMTDTSDKLDYQKMAQVIDQVLRLPFEF